MRRSTTTLSGTFHATCRRVLGFHPKCQTRMVPFISMPDWSVRLPGLAMLRLMLELTRGFARWQFYLQLCDLLSPQPIIYMNFPPLFRASALTQSGWEKRTAKILSFLSRGGNIFLLHMLTLLLLLSVSHSPSLELQKKIYSIQYHFFPLFFLILLGSRKAGVHGPTSRRVAVVRVHCSAPRPDRRKSAG